MTVTEYAAKFVELSKYYAHYNVDGEFSKCIKFENGLRPEIKQAIEYQRIRRFSDLVECCRIFEEDSKARSAHFKQLADRKGMNLVDRGKPYAAGKGNLKHSGGKRPSGGDSGAPVKCYRCGQTGHRVHECKSTERKCFKCGRAEHLAAECNERMITCFNYGEVCNTRPQCMKPKKYQSEGKVFALIGDETTSENGLIRGTCFINGNPLIAVIDTGATHSFIDLDCAKRLNLELSDMNGSMVIVTPAMGSVTTSSVCLNCPLSIFGRNFGMNLVCLPLYQLDVILGMNWLEFNRVHLNCFAKTVIFPEDVNEESLFLSARQVKESVDDGAVMFMLLATMNVEEKLVISELPIVRDFPEVFPEDVSDLPPEREVEFSIELVSGTRPISMAPYRMYASELEELKKQL